MSNKINSQNLLAEYDGIDFYRYEFGKIIGIYWFWLTDEESETPARCEQISCDLTEEELVDLKADEEAYDAWQQGQKHYIDDLSVEEATQWIIRALREEEEETARRARKVVA